MLEFLLELSFGLKTIPKKYQPLFATLEKHQCLTKEKRKFVLKSDFVIGVIDITRSKNGFLCDIAKKQDYRLADSARMLNKGDIALARLTKQRGKIKAKILSVLHSNTRVLCYLDAYKGKIVGYKLYEEKRTPIELYTSQKSLRQLPKHCVIYLDLYDRKILEILGVLDDPSIDEKIALYQHRHPLDFSRATELYAQSFGTQVDKAMYPHRMDLTHLPFSTIDPESAKDHDDALYFDAKKQILYVAIADVSEYVTPDSPIDLEARQRGFSVYFPHISYPMLPRNLSENICSLKANTTRLAFVWAISFKRGAQVKQAKLMEALICVRQNISYEEADALLAGKKHHIDKSIAPSIKALYKLTQTLKKKRLEHGYTFVSDEVTLELSQNHQLLHTQIAHETPSHSLVEESMLLANQQAAFMLCPLKYGIYRIHESIKQDKIQVLFAELKALGFRIKRGKFHSQILDIQAQAKRQGKEFAQFIDKMIIKAQNKALYAPTQEEHFALGFEAYTHFTSPIRRYSDLTLHRVLKELLKHSRQLDYLLEKIPSICAHLNEQEKLIAKIEISFKDRKFAHFAKNLLESSTQDSATQGLAMMDASEVLEDSLGQSAASKRPPHKAKRVKKVKTSNANNIATFEAYIADTNYPMIAISQHPVQGARLIMEECHEDLMRFEKIEAQIIRVDLINARIYARYLRTLD